MVLAFHYHNKMSEIVNVKRGKVLPHNFGGFCPWSIGPVTFGLVVRQEHMGEEAHLPYGWE
jgi:hypothetical protein